MTYLLAWLLLAGPLWATLGGLGLPRLYRREGLDSRNAGVAGSVAGASLGPFLLVPLLIAKPELRGRVLVWLPTVALIAEGVWLFRALFPANFCNTDGTYVANILVGGITLGAIYAVMAVGLTLIFSVQGIVSFTHGPLAMLGGIVAYQLLWNVLPVNSLLVIPLVGVLGFGAGVIIERFLLAPMSAGKVERKMEYALLVTFGLGMFLEYGAVVYVGPVVGLQAPAFTSRPLFGIVIPQAFTWGGVRFEVDYLIAGLVGLVLFACLYVFLRRTWTGRAVRAVASNEAAAATSGVNSRRVYTTVWGLGTMLTAMSGAALVPIILMPIPNIADEIALRSYVIVVLGGLGSVPGALIGGLTIGVVEALAGGCYPDPSKGAEYQVAFSLLAFAIVLLARPQGLLGRRA